MRRCPLNYPYRSDEQTTALDRLPSTMYTEDDAPFLRTQRYSLSPDYEPSDILAKQQVDAQGTMDNMYWYTVNKKKQESL